MTEPIPCAHCGTLFAKPKRPRQRFCSMACLYAGRGTGPKRRLADKPCAYCGKVFRPRDASKRFCSVLCGGRGRVKSHRHGPQPIGANGPPYSLSQAARLLGCDPGGLVRRRRRLDLGTFVSDRGNGHWEFSAADLAALGDGLRLRRKRKELTDDSR